MQLNSSGNICPDANRDHKRDQQQQDSKCAVRCERHGGKTEDGADSIQNCNSLLLVQAQIHQLMVKMTAISLKRALSVENAAAKRKDRIGNGSGDAALRGLRI